MNTKTAEERAEDRFPAFKVMDWTRRQDGYATCIREEVEPLETEVAKLRALVQVLLNEGNRASAYLDQLAEGWMADGADEAAAFPLQLCSAFETAMTAAKEHGFVPTHTTEG